MRLVSGHENVVGFVEAFLTKTNLVIVMEYADGGDLFEWLKGRKRFNEVEALYCFQQLVHGLKWCHDNQVCHRDIKLENVVLQGDDNPKLKICDFGFAKNGELDSVPGSTVGTPLYMAPEIFKSKQYSGQKADVWSCAVMLYAMVAGHLPFNVPRPNQNIMKLLNKLNGLKFDVPLENLPVSASCVNLMSKMFVVDPSQRIDLGDIPNHPWFRRMSQGEDSPMSATLERKNSQTYADEVRQLVEEACRSASEVVSSMTSDTAMYFAST